jgi:hypothetical protein
MKEFPQACRNHGRRYITVSHRWFLMRRVVKALRLESMWCMPEHISGGAVLYLTSSPVAAPKEKEPFVTAEGTPATCS